MRMAGAKKVHYDSGPNMTPLVDVVMVILIFLMLAGSFSGMEHYLASTLPFRSGGVGGAKTGELPQQQVEIHVYPSDPANDPNQEHFAAVSGSIRSSDPADLAKKLRELHDQYVTSGLKEDKIQVIISPAPNLSFTNTIKVFEAANAAKFTKIGFKAI